MSLRTDPTKAREWEARTRERAAKRAREKPRKPLSQGKPLASKKRVKLRNPARKEKAFVHAFGSVAYVDATRRSACLFCRQHSDTVRTAHLLEARKMGGFGGSVRKTGPACFDCDEAWGQGSGQTPTRKRFLEKMRMTWGELVRRVAEHHRKHGHLYERPEPESQNKCLNQ